MPVLAALLVCTVVGISDGDTLTARCDATDVSPTQTVQVRLAEIDAPEHRQAFGTKAREHLAALCFQQRAEVQPIAVGSVDRYGRLVAHVACRGVDANTEQVRAGMAWVFDRYVTDRSLYRLQSVAQTARRGLWSDSRPVAPWQWRQDQRSHVDP